MDPLDAADVHYRLASALFRQQRLAEAKDEIVRSLERAPRYRAAYDLLLKIVDAQGKDSPPVDLVPETIEADSAEPVKESR